MDPLNAGKTIASRGACSRRDRNIQEFYPGISISFVQLPLNRSFCLCHRFVADLPLRISILTSCQHDLRNSVLHVDCASIKKKKEKHCERTPSPRDKVTVVALKINRKKTRRGNAFDLAEPSKLFPRNCANDNHAPSLLRKNKAIVLFDEERYGTRKNRQREVRAEREINK